MSKIGPCTIIAKLYATANIVISLLQLLWGEGVAEVEDVGVEEEEEGDVASSIIRH